MKTNLKSLRKSRNMTQAQLAAEIGATKRQIGAWERGENDLPLDYACNIANVLGCSLDDISGRMSYAVIDLPTDSEEREERELVSLYRRMDDSDKPAFMDMARTLAFAGDAKKKDARGAASGDTAYAVIEMS